MKPLIIYHANCADGFGAAFVAWLKFGDEAEYLPMRYNEGINQDKVIDREIYILDFSFPHDLMANIFRDAKKVVWLDHHRTAFEIYGYDTSRLVTEKDDIILPNAYHVITLDNNKSGAMLAWEYFHPETEVPLLIHHIDDYDRWQFKIEGTKEFNKALWSYAPWSFEQWRELFQHPWQTKYDADCNCTKFYPEGAAILRAHDANVQAVVKGASRKCVIRLQSGGAEYEYHYTEPPASEIFDGLAANCPPHLQSDVGHQLANQSGTYGLLWYINKEGKCLCSLRSNGDYDVSVIAKAFGGGGHKNAAGFEVEIQTLLEWIK